MLITLTSDVMRTTLDIDDPLLEEVRSIQKREGGSLGRVVSRLLAEALERQRGHEKRNNPLSWHSQPMDARVDLRDKEHLYRILDEE